ncbi:hypothetical protein A2U01_0103747, partial [Trifolium medium]|nr:hypothetical protein [Trifolium medium]
MAYSNLHPPYYHPITTPLPDPSYPSYTPPFYSTTTPSDPPSKPPDLLMVHSAHSLPPSPSK